MPIRTDRVFVRLLLIVSVGGTLLAAPQAGGPAPGGIPSLIQSAIDDAKQKIATLHGPAKVGELEKKIQDHYKFASLPAPSANSPCPAVGFPLEGSGSVAEAEALDRAGAYYSTGVSTYLSGHPEVARWCFAQAAQLAPFCPEYLSNLAFTLNEDGQHLSAVTLLEHAKTLDPHDSSIYVNLAYSYQQLGKYDEAIQAMLVVIALNPGVKEYQDMLLELQKLRANRPVVIVDRGAGKGEGPSETARIDDALELLEERKKGKEDEKEVSPPKLPPGGGIGGQPRIESQARVQSGARVRSRSRIDTGGFRRLGRRAYGENHSECTFFCPNVGLLTKLGDEATESAGFKVGGMPAEKFKGTGFNLIELGKGGWKSTAQAAKGGGLVMGMMFYGFAAEIYDECCRQEGDLGYAEAEALINKAKEEAAARNKAFWDEVNKPEKFGPPVCVNSFDSGYCVSQGEKGTKKFEISYKQYTVEFDIHPTNMFRWGVKTSYAAQKEKSFKGLASANVSASVYTECRFRAGCTQGLEVGGGVGGGKFITTKAGKNYSLFKTSLEGTPGTRP
jgi:tetratricopeptide (TPR) repeat protein